MDENVDRVKVAGGSTGLRPRLHGWGQIFVRTKTCTVPPCLYKGLAELVEFLNGQLGPVYTGPDKCLHGRILFLDSLFT